MSVPRFTALGLFAALLAAPPAGACPVCESETGREVRGKIFDRDFAANLACTLAPVPAVLLAAVLIRGRPAQPAEGDS